MPVVEAGQPAPEFSLATYEGDRFTREKLLGRITVLVFYPHAFSPICTDQLSVYQEVLDDLLVDAQLVRADRRERERVEDQDRDAAHQALPRERVALVGREREVGRGLPGFDRHA